MGELARIEDLRRQFRQFPEQLSALLPAPGDDRQYCGGKRERCCDDGLQVHAGAPVGSSERSMVAVRRRDKSCPAQAARVAVV